MTIREDEQLIKRIADRTKYPLEWSTLFWELKEVHFGFCPLRLADLLHSRDEVFTKEINGIHQNVDVLNGSFRGGWKPKFTR